MPKMAFMYTYAAKVTWVESPSRFYIRLDSDTEQKCKIEHIIHQLIHEQKLRRPKMIFLDQFQVENQENSQDNSEEDTDSEEDDEDETEPELRIGQTILAKSRHLEDFALARGKVRAIHHDPILNWHYYVYFIDYGFEHWVQFEDIFICPDNLAKIDQLAYKCQLRGIYPNYLQGDGWSYEAKTLFKTILKSKSCRLQSVSMLDEFRTNFVEVSAKIETNSAELDSESHLLWFNLRDYLLLRGHGQLMTSRSSAKLNPSFVPIKVQDCLMSPCHLTENSIAYVRISHCVNPDEIYVHPLSLVGAKNEELEALEAFLQAQISLEFWNEKQEILTSHSFYRNQLCAFRFLNLSKIDMRIYRVEILQLAKKHDLYKIFALDYGWSFVCSRRHLIPLGFISIERWPMAMSVKVKICNLRPKHGDLWPEDSHDYFESMSKSDLIMFVVNEAKEVYFFTPFEGDLFCLNEEMELESWCDKIEAKSEDQLWKIYEKVLKFKDGHEQRRI